ncbi:MAG: DUF4340 domain-containing protein [Myxococcales bacterium]|jgi:hypothetical protein
MDWRKNRIAIGAVAFFALLALTLWAVNHRDQPSARETDIPSIDLEKDAITTLEITRPGDEHVVLSRIDGQWRVTAPLDAEADQTNVDSALSRLAELKLVRVVADRPENYARLQVDDSTAVKVEAKDDTQTLADLKIGKYANGMTMVRVGDRQEVFGASGSLRYAFDRELKAWRNRKIVSLESADVQSIRFQDSHGTFEFERNEDGWKTVEAPKTLREVDPKKITALVSMAARLTASDFAPADVSAARAGLNEPEARVTMMAKDDPQPIVLELGDETGNAGELYVRRNGNPTIYLISKYLADRLRPDVKAFEPTDEEEAASAAAATGAQGRELPPQLPPEVMRQLQEQIKAQQQQQR